MELEQEFTYYMAIHKVKTVKRQLVDYFRTLEQTQVNLSGAFGQSAEEKADYAIRDMLLHDIAKFERLYQKAFI